MHGGAHIFARFHFVSFLFMRAPSGPLIPFGDVGTLWAPTFKKEIILHQKHLNNDLNQYLDRMNTKLSLFEFATFVLWEKDGYVTDSLFREG